MDKAHCVIHIAYDLNQSPIKRPLLDFLYSLQRKSETFCIVHIQDAGAEPLRIRGLEVVALQKTKGADLKLIFQLRRFLKDKKATLVHTHDHASMKVGALAAKLAGIPSVHTHHTHHQQKVPGFIRALNRQTVYASEYISNTALEKHRRTSVIYDGIDTHTYNQSLSKEEKLSLREEIGLNRNSFLIGNFSELTSEEDQATLLKAFRKLIAKDLKTELIFVEGGPLQESLEALAAESGVKGHVKFLEGAYDKFKLLQVCDLVVLSAYRKYYPFLLLEAMASATPVIATKIGENPEVIIENKTGYLVPCGFPERIDTAIMRLNAINTLAGQMGESARKHVLESFSADVTADKYLELYDGILDSKQ